MDSSSSRSNSPSEAKAKPAALLAGFIELFNADQLKSKLKNNTDNSSEPKKQLRRKRSLSNELVSQAKPDEAKLESKSLIPALQSVHTLVTVTQTENQIGSRFESGVPIVFSAGSHSNLDSPSDQAQAANIAISDKIGDLPLKTEVDAILFERLDEYKAHNLNEGCVLLVTETMPSNDRDRSNGSRLNGASASLSFARKVAEVRRSATLLIDTGSIEWSSERSEPNPKDVIGLPPVEGVYEIILNKLPAEDWLILEEDEIPGFMALAPGYIPRDWPDVLRSEGMRLLIKRARAIADLIIIYAPRCIERPDVVRSLHEWTNGILIVSGVDSVAEAAEMQAISMLQGAGATLFGRIALDNYHFSTESDSDLRGLHHNDQPIFAEESTAGQSSRTSSG